MPEKGKNAFDALVEFYRREKNLFDDAPFDEYLGSVKHSITVMHGEIRLIQFLIMLNY